MTGFASKSMNHKSADKKIEIKLKSVNNRFFEFRMHASPEFLELESEVRKLVQSKVHRGSVDLYMHHKKDLSSARKAKQKFYLDTQAAEDFLNQTQKLAKKLKIQSDVTLQDILKFSGVLSSKEQDEKWDKKALMISLNQVLESFQKERVREGKALKTEIASLLQQLEKVRTSLEKLARDFPLEIKKRLKDKINNFKEDVDPDRFNQELLFLIDKSDIKEELVRLKEHIRACKDLLNSTNPEGKKLDFYAQELFREMNTVGSKSSSVKITGEVLQGKAIIEKIRQQVQNIE